MMKLRKLSRLGVVCLGVGALSVGLLYGGESAATRLKTSAKVLGEIMATPDRGIPQELLARNQRAS